MRSSLGSRLNDLQCALQRAVMVAGHLGNDERSMTSTYQSVSNLKRFDHF
jgi:hypothetical protein